MDLGTIRQNIEDGVYVTKAEAITDLMLVWNNAMTFNQPEHFVHQVLELQFPCVTLFTGSQFHSIGVTDSMCRLGRTTSEPKSALRY